MYIQVMTVMLVHSSSFGVFEAAASTLGTLIRRHSKLALLVHLNLGHACLMFNFFTFKYYFNLNIFYIVKSVLSMPYVCFL